MTFLEFDLFQADLHAKIEDLTSSKGKEYCHSEEDRFENFRTEAAELKVDLLLVVFIFFKKHYRAILYYITTGKVETEDIQGRFVDAILYLELMAGMVAERENKEEKERIERQLPFVPNENVKEVDQIFIESRYLDKNHAF